ncbi:MAG: chemotaxis protein CheB [Halioglobus sp.]
MSNTAMNIGLALSGTARDALLTALVRSGYEVQVAADIARVRTLVERSTVDAWIFDARADDVLEVLLPTGCFLLPADNIPGSADGVAVSRWVQTLLTQLDVADAVRALPADAIRADRWSEVRGVWLLAGSAGATGAVQEFLNAFRQPPPVAFLYAQHLDPTQHQLLQRFTLQNNQFSLSMSRGVQVLAPAHLVMISPRYKVTLNAFGRLATTLQPWDGLHTPDINELLVILSAAQLPAVGVIIFSGMGDDGAAALRLFEAAGGRVWAQSPASAICPAMPQAALNSGLVEKCGSPTQLASALSQFYEVESAQEKS